MTGALQGPVPLSMIMQVRFVHNGLQPADA